MAVLNTITMILAAAASTMAVAIPSTSDINYSTANVDLSASADCSTLDGGLPSQLVRGECYKTPAFQSLEFYEPNDAIKTVAVYASEDCSGEPATFTPSYIGCQPVGYEAYSVKYLEA